VQSGEKTRAEDKQVIDASVLVSLATSASFTPDAILIDLPNTVDSRALIITLENHFALWAKLMDKKATIIRSGNNEVRIPASIAALNIELAPQDEPSPLLWFANVAVSPGLLIIALDLMNNPRRAGVVRLSDELQVIQSDMNKILNPGHTMQESCTWTRSQFWHLQDLEDFRRECQQQLNPDGSNTIEFTWRSFDPALGMDCNEPGNWLEFTTRYRLYDGGDGDFYQVCDNLGMREC
jgi:hypothetical protein